MRARISSTRQAVVLGPILTAFGNRPDFTPFHQVDALTGIRGGVGGSAFLSPMIWGNRRKPVEGSWTTLLFLRPSRASMNVVKACYGLNLLSIRICLPIPKTHAFQLSRRLYSELTSSGDLPAFGFNPLSLGSA